MKPRSARRACSSSSRRRRIGRSAGNRSRAAERSAASSTTLPASVLGWHSSTPAPNAKGPPRSSRQHLLLVRVPGYTRRGQSWDIFKRLKLVSHQRCHLFLVDRGQLVQAPIVRSARAEYQQSGRTEEESAVRAAFSRQDRI